MDLGLTFHVCFSVDGGSTVVFDYSEFIWHTRNLQVSQHVLSVALTFALLLSPLWELAATSACHLFYMRLFNCICLFLLLLLLLVVVVVVVDKVLVQRVFYPFTPCFKAQYLNANLQCLTLKGASLIAA